MDWTMKEFGDANHNPVVVVNGDTTKGPVFIATKIGDPVALSAAETKDPDGHKLTYNSFHYQKATSAISKPARPEEVLGKRSEEELAILPEVRN